jgi:hypothetical protein
MQTLYEIHVRNPEALSKGISKIYLDGVTLDTREIPLTNDQMTHSIDILMGS